MAFRYLVVSNLDILRYLTVDHVMLARFQFRQSKNFGPL
ncbi:uncharacterized protein METZ01_LOCUS164792 [marine metagenome]|uniref:Uncharacterized protein n=1 Tax=marine metagenome TaxID=408172 RepID=A0A382BDT8_9ZZZZ